jgi:hypothetical protein
MTVVNAIAAEVRWKSSKVYRRVHVGKIPSSGKLGASATPTALLAPTRLSSPAFNLRLRLWASQPSLTSTYFSVTA